MKKVKRLSALMLSVLMAFSVSACGASQSSSSQMQSAAESSSVASEAKATIRVVGLKGPTGLSMVKLMSDNDAGTAKENYQFTLSTSPDEIVSKISSGEVDVAAAPTNLAATLYNKTNGKVQMAAVTTLGVLSILENGVQINNIQDLKGKTIYSSGQGATPEYALDYILAQNGLTVGKDVQVQYVEDHSQLAAQMIAGSVSIAVLPEPYVTQVLSKNSSVRIALDLTDEWDKAAGGGSVLTMGCLIVSKDFAQNNQQAFNTFLDEYKASVDFTNENVQDAASLAEKYDIMDASVAAKAIPNCNIVYMDGNEMKAKIPDFLNVLYQANPKSVGGSLPADDFYYQK